jgi:hypothetical protein
MNFVYDEKEESYATRSGEDHRWKDDAVHNHHHILKKKKKPDQHKNDLISTLK